MSPLLAIALFGAGSALVVWGTERFVEGAVGLARRWGTSPFLLAVAGFGLEPETLAAGLGALRHGLDHAALGTVVGSATFTALLALGLGAAIAPIAFRPTRGHRAGLVAMALAPLPLAALALDGDLSRLDGALLLGLAPLLGIVLWRASRADAHAAADRVEAKASRASLRLHASFWGGLAGLTLGAEVLGRAASSIVSGFGIGETFFGMVVIAAAVSLEELPRMWIPTRRGHPELALGNVVGTLLYFSSLNPGILALVSPLPVAGSVVAYHVPWMIGSAALAAVALGRGRFGRPEGAAFAALWAVYAVASATV